MKDGEFGSRLVAGWLGELFDTSEGIKCSLSKTEGIPTAKRQVQWVMRNDE